MKTPREATREPKTPTHFPTPRWRRRHAPTGRITAREEFSEGPLPPADTFPSRPAEMTDQSSPGSLGPGCALGLVGQSPGKTARGRVGPRRSSDRTRRIGADSSLLDRAYLREAAATDPECDTTTSPSYGWRGHGEGPTPMRAGDVSQDPLRSWGTLSKTAGGSPHSPGSPRERNGHLRCSLGGSPLSPPLALLVRTILENCLFL